MKFHIVAKVGDFEDLKQRVVEINGISIGVFRYKGKFYAYENVCAHQGGPVCEGGIFPNVVCDVSPDGRRLGEHLSEDEVNIACPWHGAEYDLKSGLGRADKSMKLRPFSVVAKGGFVKVRV